MRIRSIKPEFWRSPDITRLSIDDRLLFIGLWSYVDDNGVGRDEEASIVADLFAADMFAAPRETVARVSRGLANLSEAGLIARYEADGRPYLSVIKWGDHQRIDKPAKARYPRYDAEGATPRDTLATPSRDPRAWSRGAEEQRRRGEGGELPCSPAAPSSVRAIPARFDEFWEIYPRKVGKDRARTSYLAATRRTDEQVVIDGALRLAQDPNLPEAQFIPHPTTWLNRGGWQDEPLPDRAARDRRPTADDRAREHLELAARFRELENEPPADLFPQIGP